MLVTRCHDHSAGQLPRNIFRKTPHAFHYDKIALEAAVESLVGGACPCTHALHLEMRAVDEIPTEPRGEPDVPPCRPKDVHYDALPAQARDPALHLCIE
jgi:hypothetical protein